MHVADGVVAHVAHVQPAARVREHAQAVVLAARGVFGDGKGARLVPEGLGRALDSGVVVSFLHRGRITEEAGSDGDRQVGPEPDREQRRARGSASLTRPTYRPARVKRNSAPWFRRDSAQIRAAVPLDDAADGRQADAGALELVVPVQALEHAEQLARIAHVEADAVVADEDVLLAVRVADADLDHRVRPRPRVLHGVVDQVREHLQHQVGIARSRRQRCQPPLDRRARRFPGATWLTARLTSSSSDATSRRISMWLILDSASSPSISALISRAPRVI